MTPSKHSTEILDLKVLGYLFKGTRILLKPQLLLDSSSGFGRILTDCKAMLNVEINAGAGKKFDRSEISVMDDSGSASASASAPELGRCFGFGQDFFLSPNF